jgi:S-adenosylmethionine:tRNA ribosyltransferase-isomerase
VSELHYTLPEELIAQQPAEKREDARLLVVDRRKGTWHDSGIPELPELLRPGDCLVLNDTKVLPAKFYARRGAGGVVMGLFVAEEQPGLWRVMLRGSKRLRAGESLSFSSPHSQEAILRLVESLGDGQWRVTVDAPGTLEQVLERIGEAPLPPYIHRDPDRPADTADDRERYQTVYARQPGAIAAPTAGLHLTTELLEDLRDRGVQPVFVTLHVGVGTFKPVTAERLTQHAMDAESYEVPRATADALNACRQRGGRVVAVGTTSVRVLESAAACGQTVASVRGSTDLFIYPPYEFGVVDALLTNFHLPKSTLLALVMAFAGIETTRRAYAHAIEEHYRFYSYGDAMLIV